MLEETERKTARRIHTTSGLTTLRAVSGTVRGQGKGGTLGGGGDLSLENDVLWKNVRTDTFIFFLSAGWPAGQGTKIVHFEL